MVYSLLQSTLEVRNALGTTPESHLLAQVVSAIPADVAITTGNTDFQGHSVPYLETLHTRANGGDCAR